MDSKRQRQLFSDVTTAATPWERAAERDRLVARVVFNRPLETEFQYLIPDELRDRLEPGQRLRVPFGKGNRPTIGFCVGLGPPPETDRNLKSVEAVIDRTPLLSDKMLRLTRWIAEHYLCSWGQVLETVVPAGVKRKSGTREMNVFRPAPDNGQNPEAERLSPKQQAVLHVLQQSDEPLTAAEISEAAGCGSGPIDALRKKGLIDVERRRRAVLTPEMTGVEVEKEADKTLNAAQRRAVDAVLASLRTQQHHTFVLHGVTGSGKTEVYIQAVREVVGYGRQAVILVPEISLTPQTIRRFRSRFDSVAVLHSHLSDWERHWHWQRIAEGRVQVIVGARSAVFAPAPHLGLIVIDEEHETSFKQNATPRYHAREVARQRAAMEGIPLILGSATPTLETWHRVQRGDDVLLELPERVQQLPMPPVIVVDVRNDPHISHGAAIGRALASSMTSELEAGGQVILFLNLRGFTPTLWCRACGTGITCPDCDITLTWHRDRNVALCHSCDYETRSITHCPQCGHAGIRHLGIGTQRLEQEVQARFPDYSCLRMDSDSMRKPGSHDAALSTFQSGEVQILLGTQMIAKGLDFPNVTLVGVINADTLLHQPDFRAAERTFQLISQVAGRTGRSRKGGRVFVQSCFPAEPAIVMAARHNYHAFADAELQHRRELQYPPFQKMVRVTLRGPREEDVLDAAKTLAEHIRELTAPESDASTAEPESAAPGNEAATPAVFRLLGPAPAPVLRMKGLYRYHFQVITGDLRRLRTAWKTALNEFQPPKDVEFVIDVEPLNMM